MSAVELLQFVCDTVAALPAELRATIAQAILAAEKGITVDVRDLDFDVENEPEGLPPREPKRPKKEPRR